MKNWLNSLFKPKKATHIPVIVQSSELGQYGQQEIVLAAFAHSEETSTLIRQHMVAFLEMVKGYAADGKLVRAGDFTSFGPRGFLHPSIRGIVYCEPVGKYVEVPEGALLGVLVFEDELSVVQHTNVYRVLCRVGAQTKQHPVPLVSDIDRATVAHPEDRTSLLSGVDKVRVPQMTTLLQNECLSLQMSAGSGAKFKQVLSKMNTSLGLMTSPSPVADDYLIWTPGQEDTATISCLEGEVKTTSALTGGMVLLSFCDGDSVVRQVEDGFSVALNAKDMTSFQDAVASGQPFLLSTSELALQLAHIS